MRSIVTRKQEKIYNGAALMEAGIPMPVEMGEFKAYQMHLAAEE